MPRHGEVMRAISGAVPGLILVHHQTEAPEPGAECRRIEQPEQAREGIAAGQAMLRKPRREASLAPANRAMSAAVCPPPGTVHGAITSRSGKSWSWALPVRGSSRPPSRSRTGRWQSHERVGYRVESIRDGSGTADPRERQEDSERESYGIRPIAPGRAD